MSQTASLEIFKAVKQARRYALEGSYETASTFYSGLEQEIQTYAAMIPDEQSSARWLDVKTKLQAERALLTELQAELAALVNPSEGVRRDRMLARGDSQPHAPSTPDAPPARNAYVVRDMRPAQPQRQQGYTGPVNLGFGAPCASGQNNINMDDYTAPLRQVPRHDAPGSGTVNEHLYGDKDRFGPSEGPAVPTPVRRAESSPKVIAPKASPVARTPPAPAAKEAPSAGKGKVKPPIPKFSKKNDGVPSSDGPTAGKPKFVPRPGEEELASLIEGDMYVGNLNVSFNDIAGQAEAKNLLEEAVVYPILMPDYYQGIRRPWKGILMYGPPGTGKTMLAKAVASECGTTFFNISPATLTSKWRGEGEKLIRVLFDMARHYAPSTIFIDEIDSLCGQRGGGDEHEASRRAKGVLLTQMDGVGVDPGKVVMVLGATNHPWDIDEAMRRRLEKRIYIPLPTFEDRVELFKINTRSLRLSSDVDFDKLSKILDNHFYSAADITTVARDAAMMTMRRFMSDENTKRELRQRGAEIGKLAAEQPVSMEDFINAIRKVPSSVNVDQIKKFEEWKKEFETNI